MHHRSRRTPTTVFSAAANSGLEPYDHSGARSYAVEPCFLNEAGPALVGVRLNQMTTARFAMLALGAGWDLSAWLLPLRRLSDGLPPGPRWAPTLSCPPTPGI